MLTSIVPVPEVGQPFATGGGVVVFALTTAVSFESELAEPSEFFAVTRTRSVWPTSAFLSRYVEESAPPMFAQPLPCALQRRHWYV